MNSSVCLVEKPKVVIGVNGTTSNCFIDNAAYRNFLFSTFHVSSTDMESAAVVMVTLYFLIYDLSYFFLQFSDGFFFFFGLVMNEDKLVEWVSHNCDQRVIGLSRCTKWEQFCCRIWTFSSFQCSQSSYSLCQDISREQMQINK